MAESPLVSVIIPSFNSSAYIVETLQSIFDQDYPNLEVIVVDDASTDGTDYVVQPYLNRIKYIKQSENRGVSAARNAGIGVARGDLIAFVDADDLWLPERISLGVGVFADNRRVGLVATNTIVRDEKSNARIPLWESVKRTGERPTKRLLKENFICTSSTMVSKKALDKVGVFDEALSAAEDYDLWYRICREFELGLVEKPVTIWRYRPESYSSNSARQIENLVKFYEKVLEMETNADELEIAGSRRIEYLLKLGIVRSLAMRDDEAAAIFAMVSKEGVLSRSASIAIKLHTISPVLFRIARSLRVRRPEILGRLELVV